MTSNDICKADELNLKIEGIRHLLEEKRVDALLLQRVSSFAWATCGADSHINTAASEGESSLLITPQNKFILTNNIEVPRLEKEEGLLEQGWEIKAFPWYEEKGRLAKFLGKMKVGTDGLYQEGIDLSEDVTWLRSQLTEEEAGRFRMLSALCAESMREAIEAVKPGMTEYQIAGYLSQATEKRGVQTVIDLVAVDERVFTYRHPLPTAKELQRYAMLVLCGRKWGLIASITRLVHFGPIPDELCSKSRALAEIDALMIAATRPGNTLANVFTMAKRAYQQSGYPDEWTKLHQGGPTGYEPREITVTSTTRQPILQNQVFAWNPSITGTKSEDTFLVGERSNEILTEIPDWPTFDVQIGDAFIKRPKILEK